MVIILARISQQAGKSWLKIPLIPDTRPEEEIPAKVFPAPALHFPLSRTAQIF
ncbi:MAG: hypothetical protein LBW77_07730 [Verrucomicrobiota bacterium]|jgi:hypothetical protein|nr:hypothetical protein [Verrucomicrobiota bacterium]